MMECFSEWLKAQKDRDDPIGDLANDLIQDRQGPHQANPGTVRSHLSHRGACAEAHEALDEAEAEWKRLS